MQTRPKHSDDCTTLRKPRATGSSVSGYRSYDTQVSTYGGYVSSLGQDGADLTSARPGHSEHQTGLVMDIVDSEGRCGIEDNCMSQIPAGQWLAENAWQSGFVLRYPPA